MSAFQVRWLALERVSVSADGKQVPPLRAGNAHPISLDCFARESEEGLQAS